MSPTTSPTTTTRTMPSDHVELHTYPTGADGRPGYRSWCRTCEAFVSNRVTVPGLAHQSGDLHAETVHGAGH